MQYMKLPLLLLLLSFLLLFYKDGIARPGKSGCILLIRRPNPVRRANPQTEGRERKPWKAKRDRSNSG